MPLISVIIPCYNREDYICATIDSVLEQTTTDFELIVVDDGSTDSSKELIKSYKNKLTFLEHPGGVNKGQSASMNLALTQASGQYICFLDSDDVFFPEKLAQQSEYLNRNPNIGLVYSNGKSIDAQGNLRYMIYPADHTPPKSPDEALLNCSINLPSNSMVRKSIVDQAGAFSETLRAAHDHDMLIRIAEITKIGYIDEVHWCYRRHQNSISHANALTTWSDGFSILQSAVNRYGYSLTIQRKRRAVLHFRLGQCYLANRKLFPSFYNFFFSGLLDPSRAISVLLKKERITGYY